MTLKLSEVRDLCLKTPGLWQDFLAAGKRSKCGRFLTIERDDLDQINERRFKGPKLGTRLHDIIAPLARIVDRVAGSDLAGCAECAKREIKLNQMGG